MIEGLIPRTDKDFMPHLTLYEWPEFSDEDGRVYLSESHPEGDKLPENTLSLCYRTNKYHVWMPVTKDQIKDADYISSLINSRKRLVTGLKGKR